MHQELAGLQLAYTSEQEMRMVVTTLSVLLPLRRVSQKT
jgi:hypothetical protein